MQRSLLKLAQSRDTPLVARHLVSPLQAARPRFVYSEGLRSSRQCEIVSVEHLQISNGCAFIDSGFSRVIEDLQLKIFSDMHTITHIIQSHIYIITHTHNHTYTQSHIHTITHTHNHTYTQSHIHTYTQSHIHTITHIHNHTYTQSNIHTYTQSHIHNYTFTHTRNHTFTQSHIHIHVIFCNHRLLCFLHHPLRHHRLILHTDQSLFIIYFTLYRALPA